MSTVHLGAGSQDVPLKKGKLRLYSMRFCPYAQRVHLVLYAKNINHDIVYINLKNKPEWFLEKFPAGKVPAIHIEGENLDESFIISDYLDERYPQKPLYPKDPMKKAKDRLVIETFSKKVTTLLYKIFISPKVDSSQLSALFDEMDYFEKQLATRGTQYFSGDKPGMIDYMIWPWCERLEMVRLLGGEQFRVPRDRFQKMWDWSKAMLEDEAVKKHYITPEQHIKYFQSHRTGTPDFDNIL
uniref:Putative glutathione s-transferase omega-1 isoform x2 n=1 Tax=Triatoma dimidiata TaxID=72491 RepID=A0A0V0GCL5_TRIDM